MTLAASGTITMAQIATEMGVSLPIGLTDSNVRQLCGVASGSVVLPTDFYDKSWAPVCNLSVGNMSGESSTDGVLAGTVTDSDTINVTKGVASFTYQWYITGSASIIGGSTSSTLTLRFQSTSAGEISGTYYCVVTGGNSVSTTSSTGSYTFVITLVEP